MALDFTKKILSLPALKSWRETCRQKGTRVVVTNGCFDILHAGHVTYLQAARNEGDCLLVGLTSDSGVKALKGPSRPLNNESDRAALLAALQCVDAVHVFPETTAINFLSIVQPDIYVKGGDYTLETINQEERKLLESNGTEIVLLPGVPGQSTSNIIDKIQGS